MATIAETSPQKFASQHQASLLFAHLCGSEFELIIEPVDGEDARVTMPGQTTSIDLQIKDKSTTVDEHSFGSMLAHFQDRDTTTCLIDVLLAEPDRCIVFWFSSRVSDVLSPLVINPDRLPPRVRSKNPITSTDADKLIQAFVPALLKDEKLYAARRAHCGALIARIGAKRFKHVLRRVFIVENYRVSQVENELTGLLTRRYRVPSNRATVALEAVTAAIRKALPCHQDIMPTVREALREYQAERILPAETLHLDCPYELSLCQTLRRDRVLLLTGPTRCGKTRLAQALAQREQDRGVHCEMFDKVSDAERFLIRDRSPELRLALIDDPLGPATPIPDHANERHRLRRLVAALPQHRSVILTNNRTVLAQVFASSDIEDWGVDEYEWIDVSGATQRLVLDLWHAYMTSKGVSASEGRAIAELADISGRRIGEVPRAAAQAKRALGRGKSATEVGAELDRRAKAPAIADFCELPEMLDLLFALASTSSSLRWCGAETLAHILCGSEQSLPGRRPQQERPGTFSLGIDSEPVPEPPAYEEQLGIDDTTLAYLGMLEESEVVESSDKGWRFTHPSERAVAVRLDSSAKHRVLERAVFCLDTESAICALETIQLLWLKDPTDSRLVDLMFLSLQSIWPSVADRGIEILSLSYPGLSDEHKRQVIRATESYLMSRKDVIHKDGLNYFDTRQHVSMMESYDRRVALRMRSLELDPNDLASDDALIRSKYTQQAIEAGVDDFRDIVQFGLTDASPMVLTATIKGVLRRCIAEGEPVEPSFLAGIEARVSQPTAAANLEYHLANFEEFVNEYQHAKIPWEVWAVLASGMLAALPQQYRERSYRMGSLYHYARISLRQIVDTDLKLRLVWAWVEWGESAVRYGIFDDYTLATISLMMRATGTNTKLREELFARVLSQTDTAAICAYTADLLDWWDELGQAERTAIVDLLTSDRRDQRWLHAFALTRSEVPVPVVQAILGQPVIEATAIGENLLEACLYVYTAQGAFGTLAKHMADDGKGFWGAVVREIATDPNHHFFELCLAHCFNCGAIPEDFVPLWAQVCAEADADARAKLWTVLLQEMAICTGDFSKLLGLLVTVTPEEELLTWAGMIAARLQSFEAWDHLDAIVDQQPLWRLINPSMLPMDRVIQLMLRLVRLEPTEEGGEVAERKLPENLTAQLRHLIVLGPPKLEVSLGRLRQLVDDDAWVDGVRHQYYELASQQRERFRAERKFDEGKQFPDFFSRYLLLESLDESDDLLESN